MTERIVLDVTGSSIVELYDQDASLRERSLHPDVALGSRMLAMRSRQGDGAMLLIVRRGLGDSDLSILSTSPVGTQEEGDDLCLTR